MLHIATNPLAQPTAMSVGESHSKHVQSVDGGFASNAGAWTLSATC